MEKGDLLQIKSVIYCRHIDKIYVTKNVHIYDEIHLQIGDVVLYTGFLRNNRGQDWEIFLYNTQLIAVADYMPKDWYTTVCKRRRSVVK